MEMGSGEGRPIFGRHSLVCTGALGLTPGKKLITFKSVDFGEF